MELFEREQRELPRKQTMMSIAVPPKSICMYLILASKSDSSTSGLPPMVSKALPQAQAERSRKRHFNRGPLLIDATSCPSHFSLTLPYSMFNFSLRRLLNMQMTMDRSFLSQFARANSANNPVGSSVQHDPAPGRQVDIARANPDMSQEHFVRAAGPDITPGMRFIGVDHSVTQAGASALTTTNVTEQLEWSSLQIAPGYSQAPSLRHSPAAAFPPNSFGPITQKDPTIDHMPPPRTLTSLTSTSASASIASSGPNETGSSADPLHLGQAPLLLTEAWAQQSQSLPERPTKKRKRYEHAHFRDSLDTAANEVHKLTSYPCACF